MAEQHHENIRLPTPQSLGKDKYDECEVCRAIWRCLQPQSSEERSTWLELGSLHEALSTDCPGHKPLIYAFQSFYKIDESSDDITIILHRYGDAIRIFGNEVPYNYWDPYSWTLQLVKKEEVPGHPGKGRILNPHWVDIDIVRTWKKTCLLRHSATCENPANIWPVRPAWLIDIVSKCLVPGRVASTADFVALSYIYGNQAGMKIDATTLANLRNPGSFDTEEISKQVSPTIKHAMYLTGQIGERYLWADALCITHIDQTESKRELESMGAIYANALIVIIAADGAAQDGLKGLNGGSELRHIKQIFIPFCGKEILVPVNLDGPADLGNAAYDSRGWTYQEMKFARRRIWFRKNEVHWQCQCSSWNEETVSDLENQDSYYYDLHPILAGYPKLDNFSSVVRNFNKRYLRYEDDALPAISGLLSVFSRTFHGGFLYGIPEMFFEHGLGWLGSGLMRRVPSHRPDEMRLQPSGLPSWSWIGWRGLINYTHPLFFSSEEAVVNHWADEVFETFPITEWYTSASPRDSPSQRRRIKSTWYENRDSYKDFSRPLPPGWTRYLAPAENPYGQAHLHPDGCGDFIFKHASQLSHRATADQEWYYPFPVAEIKPDTLPFMPQQTEYLFCETTRAQVLGIFNFGMKSGDRYPRRDVLLFNKAKRRIGFLSLHHSKDTHLFKPAESKNAPRLVDVVAISKSRRYTNSEENATQGGAQSKSCIKADESYKVLWVEWKEGVAYRLASGNVDKDAWESLELERISLVLG